MNNKTDKKDEIVIINKFKDANSIDAKTSIENTFKFFCNLQLNKNKV